ncbi:class I SAM-dependent methyltransferase [Pelagibacteraceae bacterium]|nr:class I SAM-dependent methyltransferase [Pelagibacteraceae bacterium]
MKIIKYSKSYKNILNLQKDYREENDINLKSVTKINKKYSKQIKRTYCHNCLIKITKPFIKNFGIKYSICNRCGHLNGYNKNTDKFIKWVYSSDVGDHYDSQYSKFYNERVKNIYKPKVKFLKQVIRNKINLIDLGCGAGHFVKALETSKINATGYEVSDYLVKLGNSKLKKNNLKKVKLNDLFKIIAKEDNANVISLIGVLEHFSRPHDFFKSFTKSKIKYLYISVPCFSLTTFLENVFQKVYPRHLSGDHTHLYSKKSLEFLAKKYRLKIVGEWWFGADIPDLFRSLLVSSNNLDKKTYNDLLKKNLYSVIDELQNVLDRNKICSEVHMIFKKK